MALRNRERQSGTDEVACLRCGAEIISTSRSDAPLCLICRAVILALNFQAVERKATGLTGIVPNTLGETSGERILLGDLSEAPDEGDRQGERGKVGYIVLWFLGVPISVLLLIALIRSC